MYIRVVYNLILETWFIQLRINNYLNICIKEKMKNAIIYSNIKRYIIN